MQKYPSIPEPLTTQSQKAVLLLKDPKWKYFFKKRFSKNRVKFELGEQAPTGSVYSMLLSYGLAHRPRMIWRENLRNAIAQAHGGTLAESPKHMKVLLSRSWSHCGNTQCQVPCLKQKVKSMLLWTNSADLYGPWRASTQRIMTNLVEQEEVIFQSLNSNRIP